MIDDLLLGLGLVAIMEGLALALAPSRLRDALEALDRLGVDARRLFGLLAITVGLAFVWLARG
jgi:uncharacterized protein YjeT (DUF2065 family)